MVEQLIVIVIVGLVSAFLGALLALRFQQNYWKNIHAQQDGWENAQQSHHRNWQEKQEKLIAEAEARFLARIQQLHNDWQQWEIKDAERIAEHTRQQELAAEQARIERELARLPRIEETSMVLASKQTTGNLASSHWRPAALQGANLSGLDLSHRYLGRADLRNAQLSRTNFFMADLSGACLADADLTDADLSGANLSNADLRGATLTGANLLVSDLNNAILIGANLLGSRNLTTPQLYTTIYDSTTSLDADMNISLPHTSNIPMPAKNIPPTLLHNEPTSSNNIDLSQNDTPDANDILEETMSSLPIAEPDHEQVMLQETSLTSSAPQNEADEQAQREASPSATQIMDDLGETDGATQADTSLTVTEIMDTINESDEFAQPDTSLPVSEPIDIINELPHEEVNHQDGDAENEISFPFTDSAISDDLAISDQEIQVLSENQESKQPEKTVSPLRKTRRHNRKRAKVG